MIGADLRNFIERVIDRQFISAEDVEVLREEILRSGLSSKAEVEALLALDRTVRADASWEPVLTALVVEFMVQGREPAGVVEHDDAAWLATVLDVGGPTRTAMGIAYAVLDRSRTVGAALLDFIVRGRHLERQQGLAA
ncbi:hypothetical protein [Microvirga thermotolerans]|uniref:Uncharacterized protein n=1 Tax=Microvirga thermotolerans TaxID=2651334 RepID=A0A5P9JZE3_9HYPH|nr:hypothetical protein [Microvirga thermotolerans]QFU16780.1 hypothetical protein GDR74_11380 [Microvirga thermotolerans]